jgi:hypothetical protein
MADEKAVSIGQSLVREFRALMEPLVAIFADDELRREVLQSLGVRVPPGAPVPNIQNPNTGLASIDSYLAQSDPDMVALAGALADIGQLATALETFILGVTAGDPDVVAEEILSAFVSALTVGYMRTNQPEAYTFMRAIGIISNELFHFERLGSVLGVGSLGFGDLKTEADAVRFSNTTLFPASLVAGVIALVTKSEQLRGAYGWEPSPGSTSPNADVISDRMLYVAGKFEGEAPEGGAEVLLSSTWVLVPEDHQGVALVVDIAASGKITLKLGEFSKLIIDPGKTNYTLRLGENGGVVGSPDSKLKVQIVRDSEGELNRRWILGDPRGSRLDIGGIEFGGDVSYTDAGIEMGLKDTRLVFKVNSDLFPSGEWSAQFNLGLGYSKERGFHLGSGSELIIDLPIAVVIGSGVTGLHVQYITVGLKALQAPASGLALETSLSASFNLFGAFVATVQRIGLITDINFPKEDGKGTDIDLHFKSPMGIGLELDLGFMVGGGFIFLDPDNGSYAGILHVEFRGFPFGSLTVVGLLNERLPDGTKMTSFMLLISYRFPEPKPNILGFTLDGLGLILGVNRTCNSERLIAGVRDKTIDNLLFPEDPIANAVRIVNDARAVFPPQREHRILGGMIALGWGGVHSIVTLEIGFLLEFKADWGIARVVVMGVLKAYLPHEELGIIAIHASVAGAFDNDLIIVAGSLYESRIGFMNISGDILILARGGDNPLFIITAGGFHPAFAAPADIPRLRRLSLSISVGDIYRLTYEFNFAITSNTVQFGAKVELFFGVDEFNVYGFMSFDALFQFDPFYFRVDFRAGLAVRAGSTPILSIDIAGVLEGPNPWVVEGTGRFKIFIFSFSVNVRFTIGDKQNEPSLTVNVRQALVAELGEEKNWETYLPDDRHLLVAVSGVSAPGKLLVNPLGALQVSQRLVPLAIKLDRFYSVSVEGETLLDVTALQTNGQPLETARAEEQFARAQFQNLSNADKLSKPSFELMKSGLRASAGALLKATQAFTRTVTYEQSIRDKTRRCRWFSSELQAAELLDVWRSSPAARSSLATQQRERSPLAPPPVKVIPEGYAVVRSDSLKSVDGIGRNLSYAEAITRYGQLIAEQPERAHAFTVVPMSETQN